MPVTLFVYHRCSLDCDNSRNIPHHLFLEKNGRIAHFSKRKEYKKRTGVIFKEGHARKTICQETKKIKRFKASHNRYTSVFNLRLHPNKGLIISRKSSCQYNAQDSIGWKIRKNYC